VVASADAAFCDEVLAVVGEFAASCEATSDCDRLLARGAELPDLVILDGQLPGASEVCRWLKSHSATSAVVLCGGQGSEEDVRQRAVDAGCDHWLRARPLARQELRARAAHLLRSRREVRTLISEHDQLRQHNDWVRYLVHDLRMPLTVITANVGFFAAALADQPDEAMVDALRETDFQLKRMNGMLSDMLDIARAQRRELALERVRVDLRPLAEHAAAEVRRLAAGKTLAVTVDGDRALTADGDRSLLGRLITNLVANALRYARKRIAILLHERDGRAELQVINDGRAVPAQLEERIFLPFVKGDGGLGGAGLGLAFCRLVATEHGGQMRLRRNVDGEVNFLLSLPATAAML
jgi:signal transduction histidine kinase